MAGNLTREAIKKAFIGLLEEKSLNKITIEDITSRVGINRQTFYYHFKDILDLTYNISLDINTSLMGTDGDLSNCMMRFYDYFRSHRAVILNIVRSVPVEELTIRLKPAILPTIEHLIDNAVPGKRLDGDDRELAIDYHAAVIATAMLKWVRNGMPDNRDRFSRLADMIEMNLKNMVTVMSQS